MKIKVEFLLYSKFFGFKYHEIHHILFEKNIEEANYMIRNYLNCITKSVFFEVRIDEKLIYTGKILKNNVDIKRV
jgi:hypothetical protein